MDAPERQKRLFLVDVHHSVYVMARTPSEAEREAVRGIRENHDEPDVRVSEAGTGPVAPAWCGAVPYNADDERTVTRIVEDQRRRT